VVSTITHKQYDFVNNDTARICDCSSTNVIYLITCNHCRFQYVGQTGRKLRDRISEHRRAIFVKGKGSAPFLIKHFKNTA
jgi:hypothetical protein